MSDTAWLRTAGKQRDHVNPNAVTHARMPDSHQRIDVCRMAAGNEAARDA
jgi:hypothetical protein